MHASTCSCLPARELFPPLPIDLFANGPPLTSTLARCTSLQAPGQLFLYEPVLSAGERRAAELLGCTLIPTDEECRRHVSKPTLFFMPHCGARLYNNVLYANWGPEAICNLVLVGNSFGAYALRHTDARLRESVPYLYRVWV